MRAPDWLRRGCDGWSSHSSTLAILLQAGKPTSKRAHLAVWEALLLVRSYRADVSATARHLKWPEAKVQAAINYAKAAPYTLATRTYFSGKPVRTFTYFRKSACYRGEWEFEGFSPGVAGKKTR